MFSLGIVTFGDNRLCVSYREKLFSPSNVLFDFIDQGSHCIFEPCELGAGVGKTSENVHAFIHST